MNWDDLRYLLALHEEGTLSAAARKLGVSHATVSRRVDAFEEISACPVFDKSTEGYTLTAFGAEILPALKTIEDQVMRIERVSSAWDEAPTGRVRLAFPGFFAPLLTAQMVRHISKAHPQIKMDIVDGQRFVSLRHQEADLAVRIYSGDMIDDAPNLKLRNLGEMSWSIYASEDFCDEHGLSESEDRFDGIPFVVFSDLSPADPFKPWLEARDDTPFEVVACSSLNSMLSCIRDGVGAGPLPDFVAGIEGLVPLTQIIATYRACLVMHPDMQRSPRVRAVADALEEFFAFEGGPFA